VYAMNGREEMYMYLLPTTRTIILKIYGSKNNFVRAVNPLTNKHRLLEEVCMLYDTGLQLPLSAIMGLKLLGYTVPDDMTPYEKLNKELRRIVSDKALIAEYDSVI